MTAELHFLPTRCLLAGSRERWILLTGQPLLRELRENGFSCGLAAEGPALRGERTHHTAANAWGMVYMGILHPCSSIRPRCLNNTLFYTFVSGALALEE